MWGWIFLASIVLTLAIPALSRGERSQGEIAVAQILMSFLCVVFGFIWLAQ